MPESKTHMPVHRRAWILGALLIVIVGGGSAALAYMRIAGQTLPIDNAQVEAPVVNLSPSAPGILEKLYVREGDIVPPDTVVAQVGVELIKSTDGGLIIMANNNVGKLVNPTETVIATIDPRALRVVGQIDEDKGLASIHVGQRAVFTVDAFGGKQYEGVVDEVSPTSHRGDIVFNISDKRQVQKFDIKIRFDTYAHPELKNGMSARIWIYKQ